MAKRIPGGRSPVRSAGHLLSGDHGVGGAGSGDGRGASDRSAQETCRGTVAVDADTCSRCTAGTDPHDRCANGRRLSHMVLDFATVIR